MSTVVAVRPAELADGVEMRRVGVATPQGGEVTAELDLELLRPAELTQLSSFATISALLVVQAVWLVVLAFVALSVLR
jgi:hypothetical protein